MHLVFAKKAVCTCHDTTNLFPGAFVPVTINGNIMVDGVLASCYPSADHDLVHFVITPLRWFPELTEWIFGEDNGLQIYVEITTNLQQCAGVVPNGFVYE